MMVFIIRGTSCSGKDTFINKYFAPHTVLSSDMIRLQLFNNMKDQSKNKIVFEHLRHVLEMRLAFGAPYTVVNATNLKTKDVREYLDIANKLGADVTIISIDPPAIEELIRRSDQRELNGGLGIPDEVFQRHVPSYWNSMPAFEEMAKKGEFKWIRIGQDEEICDEI